jgi:hypothetical protein
MRRRKKTKYVHEGRYVVEVDVDLIVDEGEWSPYLSIDDAYKLDDARDALRRGDLVSASQYGRIFELRRVAGFSSGVGPKQVLDNI